MSVSTLIYSKENKVPVYYNKNTRTFQIISQFPAIQSFNNLKKLDITPIQCKKQKVATNIIEKPTDIPNSDIKIQDPFESNYDIYNAQITLRDGDKELEAEGEECTAVNEYILQCVQGENQQIYIQMSPLHKIIIGERTISEFRDTYKPTFDDYEQQPIQNDDSEGTESSENHVSQDIIDEQQEGQDDLDCNEAKNMQYNDQRKNEQIEIEINNRNKELQNRLGKQ